MVCNMRHKHVSADVGPVFAKPVVGIELESRDSERAPPSRRFFVLNATVPVLEYRVPQLVSTNTCPETLPLMSIHAAPYSVSRPQLAFDPQCAISFFTFLVALHLA